MKGWRLCRAGRPRNCDGLEYRDVCGDTVIPALPATKRSPSPIEKLKDEYRWQLWYFTSGVTKVVPELERLRLEFAWPDDITQVLNVDPVNLV